MKQILLYLFLCIYGFISASQDDSLLVEAETNLSIKLTALRAPNKTDEERAILNLAFKKELEKTFELKGVFDYPFSKLTSLGSIKSPDNEVRLFNWNVERTDFSEDYYCYIMHKGKKKDELEITELIDTSPQSNEKPEESLTYDNWYGALYYKIIPKQKSGRTYYTLLGWDGNGTISNIKLVDVLYFSGTHPKLGYNIFKTNDGTKRRLFFEYKEDAIMSLKYDSERDLIIFDHLSPETVDLTGFYAYYVPDMSYDALKFEDNFWNYTNDVITTNKDDNNNKMTIYTYNETKKRPERKEVKKEWINPSDDDLPAKNGSHVAVLPGDKTTEQVKEPEQPKLDRAHRKLLRKKHSPGSILQN